MRNHFPVFAFFVGVASLLIYKDVAHSAEFEYEAPEPGTYTLPVIKRAGDGNVLDSTGKELHLCELTHGRVTVMSFIYTRCASATACPYATGVLRTIHDSTADDGALAKGVRLVSMSFDPFDTPKRMSDYAALNGDSRDAAPWNFITTRSQAELQPILEAYGQVVDKRKNPNHPFGPLNHTVRVYLIDRDGNIRNIYSNGTLDPRLVLADIRTLLLEPSASKRNSP